MPRRPLRDVSATRVREILEQHQKWVESHDSEENRADLSGVNLQGWDLSRRNLRDAHMGGSNLRGANLQGATLVGTMLHEADLQDADLSETTGLFADQLAGANLCHAIVPKDVLESDRVARVAETSRSVHTLLWSMLGACSYAWLTIWTTTDTGLLTNRTTSTLPVIGGTIPISVFFVVMPLILLGCYLYLHFQLQHLWEGLARLPAVFPDGRPLDHMVDLGLLSSLLPTYRAYLREGSGGTPMLLLPRKLFAILLAWAVVPITLVLFWGRYLAAHHWWVTAFHLGLLITAIGAGIGFRHLMAVTLSGTQAKAIGWKSALVVPAGSVAILTCLSFYAIEGIPPDQYAKAETDKNWAAPGRPPYDRMDFRIVVPRLLDTIGVTPFADFEKEATIAVKPQSWTGETKTEITGIEVVNISERNLRHAKGYGAFLAGANMRGADLTGANFRQAALHGANLEGASLAGANLRWAQFRWSRLLDAKLPRAELSEADLREADLRRADLQGANLTSADLRGADLQAANLQWANLGDAKMGGFESNQQSTNFEGADLTWAYLSDAQLQGTNLSAVKLRWATLTKANLQGANLSGADLRGANLQKARLQGAYLVGADLRETDFRNVSGLTFEQIELAMIDDTTILPERLKETQ
jgi:uncharacterized protein YjbI with pentapeptide repeats